MKRFLHNNLVILFSALAAIIALSSWFLTAEPKAPPPATHTATTWDLLKLPENLSSKSMETINARNLWGVTASNATPEPKWTIQGIARSAAERFVLLAYEGKPVEILKVGDTLPDGAKIVQIDNDRFLVQTSNKEKLAFGIYKNETRK